MSRAFALLITSLRASPFTLRLGLGNLPQTIILSQRAPSGTRDVEAERQQFHFFVTATAHRAIGLNAHYPIVFTIDLQSLWDLRWISDRDIRSIFRRVVPST
jgi:hypothetical protein